MCTFCGIYCSRWCSKRCLALPNQPVTLISITVVSRESHGVSNQATRLFVQHLLRLTAKAKQTPKHRITRPLWWKSLMPRPHQIHAVIYYSTGVQIVSCTLSVDSVLSESTGLFNPVLCVSQWNIFWQKNQPIRLCLSNQVRPGGEWFPSPLGDFNRLFEGLIGELFKVWHWNMFYFFKWHQSSP